MVKFLMKCTGETVVVECKDGSMAQGTIVGVDVAMNVHMKNVKFTEKKQKMKMREKLTVRGNNIRVVLLPDEMNIDNLLVGLGPKPETAPAPSAKRKRDVQEEDTIASPPPKRQKTE